MENPSSHSFETYLMQKGIGVVDYFDHNEKISLKKLPDDKVRQQLYNISQFHKETMGYKDYIGRQLNNKIGKAVEESKISLRKFKRDISNLKTDLSLNIFEKLVVENSDEYIKRAENCIGIITKCNYINLLSRSMKRCEICIGDIGFDNIKMEQTLKVKNISKCSYDMVEMDAVYLLRKIRRNDLNWDDIICEYCSYEGLTDDSRKFILALTAYPCNVIKLWERYKKNENKLTTSEYCGKMKNYMKKDNKYIILNTEI